MFSTAQQQYIEALIPTYAKAGYKYYVCYTHTNTNSGYFGSTDPDLYALFSKEAISSENAYTYDIEDAAVLVAIRSGNYSSSSTANNGNRLTVTDYTQSKLTIPGYEHIYSNAEFTGSVIQPDFYISNVGDSNVKLQGITFLLCVSLLITIGSKLFRR